MTLECDVDRESVYSYCDSVDHKTQVIFSNLFYTNVLVQGYMELKAMVDNGSMARTLSLLCRFLREPMYPDAVAVTSVTLIGCGGLKTSPLRMCDLQMKVF